MSRAPSVLLGVLFLLKARRVYFLHFLRFSANKQGKSSPSFLLGVLFLLKGPTFVFFAFFAFFGQTVSKNGRVRRELDVRRRARNKMEVAIFSECGFRFLVDSGLLSSGRKYCGVR